MPASLDMYRYVPTSQSKVFTSCFGVVFTVLTFIVMIFYIAITTTQYIRTPPEIASSFSFMLPGEPGLETFSLPDIGLAIKYRDSKGNEHHVDSSNRDRFFRFSFEHVTVIDQAQKQPRIYKELGVFDKVQAEGIPGVYIQESDKVNHKLEGTALKKKHQFIRVAVVKCVNSPECAPEIEIESIILSGDVTLDIVLEMEQFDVKVYQDSSENHEKRGVVPDVRILHQFAMPYYHQIHEVSLKARRIQILDLVANIFGVPLNTEHYLDLLSYDSTQPAYKSATTGSKNIASFMIRLQSEVMKERILYRTSSIFYLFASWGAMFSFLTALSLGFVASQYNKWKFHRSPYSEPDDNSAKRQSDDHNHSAEHTEDDLYGMSSMFNSVRKRMDNSKESQDSKKTDKKTKLKKMLSSRVPFSKRKETGESTRTALTSMDGESNRDLDDFEDKPFIDQEEKENKSTITDDNDNNRKRQGLETLEEGSERSDNFEW